LMKSLRSRKRKLAGFLHFWGYFIESTIEVLPQFGQSSSGYASQSE
jgi:hypothetical protein